MGCTLCPRKCGANRGIEPGFCGVKETLLVARVAPHYFEEPCISGTRGSGTVFLSGCCLKCRYCQNAALSHGAKGKEMTPLQLCEALKKLVEQGVCNISFVTPTHYTRAIIRALNLYRPPLPIVWNSGGYERVETLKQLEGLVDVYLPDIKHYTEKMGGLIAAAPDYFQYAKNAVIEMCRQTGPAVYDKNGIMQRGTLIRHLVLPGLTGESLKILDFIKEHLPQGVPVSLMRQYFPANGIDIPGLDRCLTDREYDRVLTHMLALNLNGFYQEKESARGCYVPAFNAQDSF